MTAALGTLVFLVTLWMLAIVGAAILEESGAKIIAALKGRPARRLTIAPMRMRVRYRTQHPMRATAKWRAAA